jgi:hypothetical protein
MTPSVTNETISLSTRYGLANVPSVYSDYLPLHQFDSAIFGSPLFFLVGCDRGIEATAERIQTGCRDAIRGRKFCNDARGTPAAQIKVVI